MSSRLPALDTSDRPFGLAPDIVTVMHLPRPPSVNRIWRPRKGGKGFVCISPEYADWKLRADMHVIATGQMRGVQMITGKFEADIVIERAAGDLDNRVKALFDWAQSRSLIADDKHCEMFTVKWGEAPAGCRLILRGAE